MGGGNVAGEPADHPVKPAKCKCGSRRCCSVCCQAPAWEHPEGCDKWADKEPT